MNVRRIAWIVWVLAITGLFAGQSEAADITFFVGGVNPGSISVNDVETSLDNSPIYGFRIATNFVPTFGLEHTLAFSSDYLYPHNVSSITEAKGFVYNSNMILNMPMKKIVPYLTAGAGVIHQYGDQDMPVGTKFAFNYGGGLKLPRLWGPLGVRFDMRGYSAAAFSNKLNLFEVSGGVLLSLGK